VKTLITGNLGYIGTVLSQHLVERDFEVLGFDSGYYKECLLDNTHVDIPTTVRDIRSLRKSDFVNFTAVVHLAALSNDPIGELDPKLTYEINHEAAVTAAKLAKEAGVSKFVFVSSQSIYGISNSDFELNETAQANPQTAYAKSKWMAEKAILEMATPSFTTVSIRPSTVFGWSPRLRSDIVFNNLLITGYSKGRIEVHSDGSPWRPIVHVSDLSEAIRLTLLADKDVIAGEIFNIGKIGGNYTVREIAESASVCLGGVTTRFNTENIVDPRSYRVSFDKALGSLGFMANRELVESGIEMLEKFKGLKLEENFLLGRMTNRLAQVGHLKEKGEIDADLRFH
jgi:nucleoside-diphosphate-sugar epimerase